MVFWPKSTQHTFLFQALNPQLRWVLVHNLSVLQRRQGFGRNV